MGIMTLSKHGAKAPPAEPVKEAPVSKKAEAFELFAQGKEPGDPELEALGLATSTITKYYREWKKLNPTEETLEEES